MVCSCQVELDQAGAPSNGILRNASRMNARVCGKKSGAPITPTYCCHDCNRLSGRIYRLQQKDPSLVAQIEKLTKEDKKMFYEESRSLMGDQLVAKIRATVGEVTESSNTGSFAGKGVWLDEEDLDDKYKSKPFQLACVKERGRTMVHPIRGCTLWEDIDFTTEAANSNKHKIEQGLRTESEERVKKPRRKTRQVKSEKQEEAKGSKPSTDKGRGSNPLTDKGREKNTKLRSKLQKQSNELKELLDNANQDGIKEYIGPIIFKQAQEATLELHAAGAALDVMLEDGWAGKAAEVERDVRKKSDNAKEQYSRLQKQATDALEITLSSAKGGV